MSGLLSSRSRVPSLIRSRETAARRRTRVESRWIGEDDPAEATPQPGDGSQVWLGMVIVVASAGASMAALIGLCVTVL